MKQTVAIAGACIISVCTFLGICEFFVPEKETKSITQLVSQPVEFTPDPFQEVEIYSDVSGVTNSEFSLVFDFKNPFPEFDGSFIEFENCAPFEWVTSDNQRYTVKFTPYGAPQSIVKVFGAKLSQSEKRDPLGVFSVELDLMGPKISSIERPLRSRITTRAEQVEFIVRFNEPVDEVSFSDFMVSQDWGAATGRVTKVLSTTNPNVYRVFVGDLEGDHQRLTIDVHEGHDIRDLAGNSFTGETLIKEYYVVDVVPPKVNMPEKLEYMEHSFQTISLGDFSLMHWDVELKRNKDAHLFEITENRQLAFKSSPSFDEPLDKDRNNLYELEVVLSDGVNKTVYPLEIHVHSVNMLKDEYLSSREE